MAIVNTANNVMPSSLMAAMNPTSASTATSGSASANSMQSQFMTLLVTQLQNQDPTNPMDSTQMTSQLAQISTVSGIQQLNTTLQSLMSTFRRIGEGSRGRRVKQKGSDLEQRPLSALPLQKTSTILQCFLIGYGCAHDLCWLCRMVDPEGTGAIFSC